MHESPQDDALRKALRAQTDHIAEAVASRARSKWLDSTPKHTALIDLAIDQTKHYLGEEPPEIACASTWIAAVSAYVLKDVTNAPYEHAQALRPILERCRAQAEALARTRLENRGYPDVRSRIQRLSTAIGDDMRTWRLPLLRLLPLGSLPLATSASHPCSTHGHGPVKSPRYPSSRLAPTSGTST